MVRTRVSILFGGRAFVHPPLSPMSTCVCFQGKSFYFLADDPIERCFLQGAGCADANICLSYKPGMYIPGTWCTYESTSQSVHAVPFFFFASSPVFVAQSALFDTLGYEGEQSICSNNFCLYHIISYQVSYHTCSKLLPFLEEGRGGDARDGGVE